jgi:hypothetical protein
MSAHSKDDSTAAERYACIGRLSWEAEQKKDKSSPKSDLRRSGSLRAKAGKADSKNCSGGSDGDDDDGGSRRQANKKKFDAATAGKRAMRVDGKIGEGRTGEAGFRDSRFAGRTRERLDLAIADSAGGVQAK